MSEFVAAEAFDAIDFTRAGVQHERLIQEWDKLNEVHLQLNIGADKETGDEKPRIGISMQ